MLKIHMCTHAHIHTNPSVASYSRLQRLYRHLTHGYLEAPGILGDPPTSRNRRALQKNQGLLGPLWAQQTAHAQRADWLPTQSVQGCSCALPESTQSLPSGYSGSLTKKASWIQLCARCTCSICSIWGWGCCHSVQKSSSQGQSGLPNTGISRK